MSGASTCYWPQLSAAGELGNHALTALLGWLAIAWMHLAFGHVPAGILRWIG